MNRMRKGAVLAVFILLFGAVPALAYNLLLTATDQSGNELTQFERGDDLYLHIEVDDPAGIAGAAFTLEYDPAFLTAPATSADGTPVTENDITSSFPFSFQSGEVNALTHRENSDTANARILFAGATIDPVTGGPKDPSFSPLFSVRFTVKADAVYNTPFAFNLVQTLLWNPLAGYGLEGPFPGTPVTVDRAYNPGNGDQMEPVPVLVGALPSGHADFNDLTKAFPLLTNNLPVTKGSLQVVPCTDDTDEDGMPDCWEEENGLNPLVKDGTQDADFDGYTNYQEYLNGTDPWVQNAAGGAGYIAGTDNRLPYWADPTVTPDWEDYSGLATISGEDVAVGDELAAFADSVLVGRYVVDSAGAYGSMRVYGESSLGAGDGAVTGDLLTFKVWDKSTMTEYPATATVTDGSANPPEFEGQSIQKAVDIDGQQSQKIPLKAGWNLVSFSVAICFHDTDTQPVDDMPGGISYQKMDSLKDVLVSIDGNYTKVKSINGVFDPALDGMGINTLHYLAPGHGYWIKMTQDGILEISGPRVQAGAGRDLVAGWNLMGYWPNAGKYDTDSAPVGMALPDDATLEQVGSLKNVLNSIDGSYTKVKSIDGVFDPALDGMGINTLHCLAPGYGYWIKMSAPGTLVY